MRFDCSSCPVTDRNKGTPWERDCIGKEHFFVGYAESTDNVHTENKCL